MTMEICETIDMIADVYSRRRWKNAFVLAFCPVSVPLHSYLSLFSLYELLKHFVYVMYNVYK